MIEYIPEVIEAGIDSLKIEGRMKTALYVATVARTYRKAIDDYFESEKTYRNNMEYYKEEIAKCTYRMFTTGFYFGKPTEETQIYDNNTYIREFTYLGTILDIDNRGMYLIEQKNKFVVGEEIEAMIFDGSNVKITVEQIMNEKNEIVDAAPHPKEMLYIKLNAQLQVGTILRRDERDN